MSRPEDDPSVFNEPHLRPDRPSPDPTEARADAALARERKRREQDHRDGHSVYDEPDVFPGRPVDLIEQDWSCSNCGYNLRGLPTGHRCPECGHRELYRPAAEGLPSYQNWLRQRVAATPRQRGWYVAVLAALCGGPWAVLAALIHTNPGGLTGYSTIIVAVVFGPAVEEVMKIAVAACIVEVRPYLFRRAEQLHIAAAGSALLFAVIENILYLTVYVPNHSLEYALWRWTVCVAMHVGCTLIATRGLVEVWRRTITEYRPAKLTLGFSALVAAIVAHAGYNAAATVYELAVR
jgi:DNA-directed RNA polymerase subunit RPC12/RpoP